MRIDGRPMRTLWPAPDGAAVEAIDQTLLPHRLRIVRLATMPEIIEAINVLRVRGAPLIGGAAAYGLALALRADPSDAALAQAYRQLLGARPTAVNLRRALDAVRAYVAPLAEPLRAQAGWARAGAWCEADVISCQRIGEAGYALIEAAHRASGREVNILTHCNAGWLATIDWGTASAPIYLAHDRGIPVHVWVDETRPRNQGAMLTAYELGQHGVPHTLIADNAGGHLMQHGRVDLCIVGADRVSANGDAANKIGTYLKALAARDNGVSFYVAIPETTMDWTINDGLKDIPIEERDANEVTHATGLSPANEIVRVRISPSGTPAVNPAFDVTPAALITGFITERGVCAANGQALAANFGESYPADESYSAGKSYSVGKSSAPAIRKREGSIGSPSTRTS